MTIFDRKTGDIFPVQVKIGAVAVALGGLLTMFDNTVLGFILLVASILVLFTHNGVMLDFDAAIYKEYWGLFGLKFGNWKTLPKIWRITMTTYKTIYRNQSHGTGLSTYSGKTQTALNLRFNDFDFLCIAKGKYQGIREDALFLANRLGLEILDATTPEKKIIKPV